MKGWEAEEKRKRHHVLLRVATLKTYGGADGI